ncbi:MAG TPA: hypothetical protein VIG99_15275 [Myxococcaceae bacterium]|jgi:hypothetical protein
MPRAFDITPSAPRVKLNSGEAGEVSFTVSNKLPRTIRTRALARAEGETDGSWLAIPPDSAEVELGVNETKLFTVKVRLPASLKEGTYAFHIVVSSLAEPDEIYAESASVPILVKHVERPFPWWIVYLAGGVLVLALGTWGLVALLRSANSGPPGANCTSDMDCPNDQRCVQSQPGSKSCLLKPEEKCTGDIQCASAYCHRDDHLCSRDDGKCTAATAAKDCRPGTFTCVGDTCLLVVGQKCANPSECQTGVCFGGACQPCQAVCFPPSFCQGNQCVGPIIMFQNKSVSEARRFEGLRQ